MSASELLEKAEEAFPRYYKNSDFISNYTLVCDRRERVKSSLMRSYAMIYNPGGSYLIW